MRWQPRDVPLTPEAVLCKGVAARLLGLRVVARGASEFTGVVGDDLIVVIGADLPWVEGALWLGRDRRVPEVWMPTLMAPDVHPALVRGALTAQGVPMPCVWTDGLAIPLHEAQPFDAERLVAWCA